MCIRLYPDIIIAAEINNAIQYRKLCGNCSVTPIHVSINGCLLRQRDYKQFGLPNLFTGFEGHDWDENDYKAYFAHYPEYFHSNGDGYDVDVGALIPSGIINASPYICGKLFTETYPIKVLDILGLRA